MNKIFSTLNDSKNWIEAFLDNKDKFQENEIKVLEFINKQKLSCISMREDFVDISFTFEYDDFNNLPKEVKEAVNIKITDTSRFLSKFLLIINWCGIEASMSLYDISEKSEFLYENFMHSLGNDSKKYIVVNIDFNW